MLKFDTTFPVVLLKAKDSDALGVVRSLGRLGVPIYGIGPSASSPCLRSRYCRGRFLWDIDQAPAEESVGFLREAARRIGIQPLLFPIDHSSSLFVDENRNALNEDFIFSAIPPETFHSLANKRHMYFTCKVLGIPTAETAFPQSQEEVSAFAATATFPIVLKPINPGLLVQDRIVIARNRQELLESCERVGAANLLLQEYIPGGDESVWMFNGYFNRQSECLFGTTGKKLRQFPAYGGVTSLGICLKNEIVEETTKQLMKAVRYQGILDIGYRYDARDGKYKLLDVNPRLGGTARLFVGTNGMDVARAWYLDLTEQPVPAAQFTEGRKWLAEEKDLVSSLRYYRDDNLGFGEWVRSFSGVEEVAYLSLDDPVPAVQRAWNLLAKVYKQRQEKRVNAAGSRDRIASLPAHGASVGVKRS